MKLLVNTTPLQGPLAGIGRYTREILLRLLEDDELEDVVGFSESAQFSKPELLRIVSRADEPGVWRGKQAGGNLAYSGLAALRPLVKKIPYARVVHRAIIKKNMGRQGGLGSDYVYWEPNFVLQASGNPAIATIHDLSYLRYPQFHPEDRVRWLTQGMPPTLARADALVAVSEFGKAELIAEFAIAEDRVSVISPGLADEFRHDPTDQELATCRQHYRLPERFVLSVATLEPRKNTAGLVRAYRCLPVALRKRYPLVLVGGAGWKNTELEKLLAELESEGEVHRLGFVPQVHLPSLYAAASLFVYVSFYEGFGMPIIEAMASGTPVITSDRGSMREIASGFADLVDPHNKDQLVDLMQARLAGEGVSPERLAVARAASHRYCWRRSADKLKMLIGANTSASMANSGWS